MPEPRPRISRQFQFFVLFRQFLFRVVDLESLSVSARGDSTKLLGQFAAILVYLSLLLAWAGAIFEGGAMPTAQRLAAMWGIEIFLISATMLTVGIFALLSWDSMFPDRRDVFILGPLPIDTRTLLRAKITAVAAALGISVFALHSFSSLIWPLRIAPEHSGMLGVVRTFVAYWLTMVAAAVFMLCCLLALQGMAALLPRWLYLRISAWLQLAAFTLLVAIFFLQPAVLTPDALTSSSSQWLLAWLPTYWFLGLFQALDGTMSPAVAPLARWAAIGLLFAIAGAALAFSLSYFYAIRKIAEEPDITARGGGRWLPGFGSGPVTALAHFTIRSLFRSRQHRLIVSFFLALGFANVILYVKTPIAQTHLLDASSWRMVNVPLLASTAILLCFAVIGLRVVFAIPVDLRSHWIFQIADAQGLPNCMNATRRTLIFLAAPVWLILAVILLWLWPVAPATGHLILLALLAAILIELCLHNFHKIPFACSYLPGKANIYVIFFACVFLLVPTFDWAAQAEWNALESVNRYLVAASVLLAALIVLRSRNISVARDRSAQVHFEELEPPAILELGIRRDDL